ncbi:SDR family NAD(P)-dependent oxidoreductase [Streptomyces lasalocidi]
MPWLTPVRRAISFSGAWRPRSWNSSAAAACSLRADAQQNADKPHAESDGRLRCRSSGLGASVARRFGREGFRVALVARRRDRPDALAARLGGEGIEAAVFPADLSDPAGVPALVGAVRERFGRTDVVEYAPIGGDTSFAPARRAGRRPLEKFSRLLLRAPVEVARAVLPEMTAATAPS